MTNAASELAKASLAGFSPASARVFAAVKDVAPRQQEAMEGTAPLLDALNLGRSALDQSAPAMRSARGLHIGVPAAVPRPNPPEVVPPPPSQPIAVPLRASISPVAADGETSGASLAMSVPECILQPQWSGSCVRLCPNPQCPRNDNGSGPPQILRLNPYGSRRSGTAATFCDTAPTAAAVPTAASSLGRVGLDALLSTRAAAEEAAEAAEAQRQAVRSQPRPALRSPQARPRSAAPPTVPRAPPASPAVSPPRSPPSAPTPAKAESVSAITTPPMPVPPLVRTAVPAPRAMRAFVSETELFGGFDDDVWAPGAQPQQPGVHVAWTDSSADSLASLALSDEAGSGAYSIPEEAEAEVTPPRSKLSRRDSDYDASDDLDGDSVDAWGSRAQQQQQCFAANAAPMVQPDGTVRVADLVAATRRSVQAMAKEEEDDYEADSHDTL